MTYGLQQWLMGYSNGLWATAMVYGLQQWRMAYTMAYVLQYGLWATPWRMGYSMAYGLQHAMRAYRTLY